MSALAYQNVKGSTTLLPTGQRGRVQLDNRVQTNALGVRVTTTLVVSGVATGNLRTGGRPTNGLRFAVAENGNDQIGEIAMRPARLYAEAVAGQAFNYTAPAGPTLAVGTHVFEEYFVLPFSNPLGVDPFETAYKEADPSSFFTFEPLALPALIDCIVSVGAATVTASVVVEVEQFADPARATNPYFKPRWREITQNVNGTNQADIINIRTRQRLQALMISQEVTLASGGIVVVSDIVSALRLIGDDGRNVIGPNQTPWTALNRQQAAVQGGEIATDAKLVNFQKSGRLSYTIVPESQFPNFRIEASDALSATAGSSRVRVVLFELTRPAPQNGYSVVSLPEELPGFLR